MSLLFATSRLKCYNRLLKPNLFIKPKNERCISRITQLCFNHEKTPSFGPIIQSPSGFVFHNYDVLYFTGKRAPYILVGIALTAIVIALLKSIRDAKTNQAYNHYRLANLWAFFLLFAATGCGYYFAKTNFLGKRFIFIPLLSTYYMTYVSGKYRVRNRGRRHAFRKYYHIFTTSAAFLTILAPIIKFAPKPFLVHFISSMFGIIGSSTVAGLVNSDPLTYSITAPFIIPTTGFAVCLLASRIAPISILSLQFLLAYFPTIVASTSVIYGNYKSLKHFEEFKDSNKRFQDLVLRITRKFCFTAAPWFVWKDILRATDWRFVYRDYRVITRDQYDPEIHATLEEDHYRLLWSYYTDEERKGLGIQK